MAAANGDRRLTRAVVFAGNRKVKFVGSVGIASIKVLIVIREVIWGSPLQHSSHGYVSLLMADGREIEGAV